MKDEDCNVDVELFIEDVKQYPTIWNLKSDDYKNRLKKQAAWNEICKNIHSDFDSKSEAEKNSIIKRLSLKWKNIKDNYARSIRKRAKSGQPGRKYLYAKHLAFLHESMASAETNSSTEDPESLDSLFSQHLEVVTTDQMASNGPVTSGPSSEVDRTPAKRRDESASSFTSVRNASMIVEPSDSDRAFFESLIPIIGKFTEDQKLDFRSDVLDVIKNIKKQSAVQPRISSNSTQPHPKKYNPD